MWKKKEKKKKKNRLPPLFGCTNFISMYINLNNNNCKALLL